MLHRIQAQTKTGGRVGEGWVGLGWVGSGQVRLGWVGLGSGGGRGGVITFLSSGWLVMSFLTIRFCFCKFSRGLDATL